MFCFWYRLAFQVMSVWLNKMYESKKVPSLWWPCVVEKRKKHRFLCFFSSLFCVFFFFFSPPRKATVFLRRNNGFAQQNHGFTKQSLFQKSSIGLMVLTKHSKAYGMFRLLNFYDSYSYCCISTTFLCWPQKFPPKRPNACSPSPEFSRGPHGLRPWERLQLWW